MIFQDKYFPRMFLWTRRVHFWQPCWKSLPEWQPKSIFLLERKSFLEMFEWTCRLQFWLASLNVFQQRDKKRSVWCPKLIKWKPYPKKSFTLKFSYGHVECCLEIHARKVLTKSDNLLFNVRQWLKNIAFSKKNLFFLSFFPLDMQNAVLKNPSGIFWTKPRNFPPKIGEKNLGFPSFSQSNGLYT